MRKPRRGRAQLRLRLLDRILRLVRDPEYRRLLLGTVQTYFGLTAAESAEEERLLRTPPFEEIREMITTEFDRVEVKTKQDDLLRLLAERYGPVQEEMARRVRRVEDTEELDRLLSRFVHAKTLEDMGL